MKRFIAVAVFFVASVLGGVGIANNGTHEGLRIGPVGHQVAGDGNPVPPENADPTGGGY